MNLLGLDDLSEQQINDIFNLTDRLQLHIECRDLLRGKTFILFFPESSIRTRITFEKGIRQLGGECILFRADSLDKKEQLEDVVQYVQNWADGVIVRHGSYAIMEEMARYAAIPMINAMNSEQHPCEILSDLYSLQQIKRNYRELTYTYVGPASNIGKTWASAAKVLNLSFHHVCIEGQQLSPDHQNYTFHIELEPTLTNSDIILTDSLPSEFQNQKYIDQYQINYERMKLTRGQSLLNPCPPFFRNEEVSADVISSDYFVGYGFKKNLLYLQQAVILYCLGISLD